MGIFKNLFKKNQATQPAQLFLTSFQTSLPVYGSKAHKLASYQTSLPVYGNHSHEIGNYQDQINQWLDRDLTDLCQASLEQALDFLTYTDEAFFCFFDPEDDPGYAADLLASWTDPNMTNLVDYLER